MYKLIVLLFILPSIAHSYCFERFYSQKHLEKYPKQEIRNVLFSYGNVDGRNTDYDFQAKLQINMIKNGQLVVAEAEAKCKNTEGSRGSEGICEVLKPGSGTYTYKLSEDYSVFSSDNILLRVNGDTKFKNKIYGDKGELVTVPKPDRVFRAHQNKVNRAYLSGCEETLYKTHSFATNSRFWNEVLLHSIRNDLARPTVTARNLFHFSALMWDVNASYKDSIKAYFHDAKAPKIENSYDKSIALRFAAYTFLKERYKNSPGNTADRYPLTDGEGGDRIPDMYLNGFYDRVMKKLSISFEDEKSVHAQFGIKMAKKLIASQLNDGSREPLNYAAEDSYVLKNPLLMDISQSGITTPGEEGLEDLDFRFYEFMDTLPDDKQQYAELYFDSSKYRGENIASQVDIDSWIRLNIPGSVDQGGTSVANEQSPLTLFWGELPTFSNLKKYKNLTQKGLYFDPGEELLRFSKDPEEFIKRNIEVVDYSSLLSPLDLTGKDFDNDGRDDYNPGAELIDISPAVLGNNTVGTNDGVGRKINPVTQKSYAPNKVKAADYYRSIAEFWADGPQSETPPGHWNTLANYTMDQMLKHKVPYKWMGEGEAIDRELYELKMYLTLNGALHDAAIVAWGIKSVYQGSRPIMVIRKLADMAEKDPDSEFTKKLLSYSKNFKMMEYLKKELQEDGSIKDVKVKKLMIKAWRGEPSEREFDLRDLSFDRRSEESVEEGFFYRGEGVAGVGWILAENWQPYQRSSFVTPPFPGFVSGHSTFSRAAAEVLAGATGSEYFPGGLGTYPAPQLHFERMKMEPFEFHWATYYDASDVSGISRIYGGIHASYDDLPARKIGAQIGISAIERAKEFFQD